MEVPAELLAVDGRAGRAGGSSLARAAARSASPRTSRAQRRRPTGPRRRWCRRGPVQHAELHLTTSRQSPESGREPLAADDRQPDNGVVTRVRGADAAEVGDAAVAGVAADQSPGAAPSPAPGSRRSASTPPASPIRGSVRRPCRRRAGHRRCGTRAGSSPMLVPRRRRRAVAEPSSISSRASARLSLEPQRTQETGRGVVAFGVGLEQHELALAQHGEVPDAGRVDEEVERKQRHRLGQHVGVESSIAGRESREARSWATPSRASSSVAAEAAHAYVSRNARILAVKSRDGSRNSTCSSPSARAGAIHASGYGCESTAGASRRPAAPGRGGTRRFRPAAARIAWASRASSAASPRSTAASARRSVLSPCVLGRLVRQRPPPEPTRRWRGFARRRGHAARGRRGPAARGPRSVSLRACAASVLANWVEAAREGVERDGMRTIDLLGRDQRILLGVECTPELGGPGRQLLHLRPVLPSNRRPALRQQAIHRRFGCRGRCGSVPRSRSARATLAPDRDRGRA